HSSKFSKQTCHKYELLRLRFLIELRLIEKNSRRDEHIAFFLVKIFPEKVGCNSLKMNISDS
ncbi:MAG: hypothetical protein AAGA66_10105, partial [Bacteroidota bacterium]